MLCSLKWGNCVNSYLSNTATTAITELLDAIKQLCFMSGPTALQYNRNQRNSLPSDCSLYSGRTLLSGGETRLQIQDRSTLSKGRGESFSVQ